MARYTVPAAWTAAGVRFGADGLLYLGVWRRGFTPGELQALFFDCQQVHSLRTERDAALRDLARAEARIEAMESRLFWYRSQLTREARLGAVLARLYDSPAPGQARP